MFRAGVVSGPGYPCHTTETRIYELETILIELSKYGLPGLLAGYLGYLLYLKEKESRGLRDKISNIQAQRIRDLENAIKKIDKHIENGASDD